MSYDIYEQISSMTQKIISDAEVLKANAEATLKELDAMCGDLYTELGLHATTDTKDALDELIQYLDGVVGVLNDIFVPSFKSDLSMAFIDYRMLEAERLSVIQTYCVRAAEAIQDITNKLRCRYADTELIPELVEGVIQLCDRCLMLAQMYGTAGARIGSIQDLSKSAGDLGWNSSSRDSSAPVSVKGSAGTGKSGLLKKLGDLFKGKGDSDKNAVTPSATPAPPVAASYSAAPVTNTASTVKNIYADSVTDTDIPTVDRVQFSAVAPKGVEQGKYVPVNIVMYEDEFRTVVEDIIASHDMGAKESKSGYKNVERGSRIRVVLTSPDITVDDDCPEQIWSGGYLDFEFAVKIPKDYEDEQILFTASVYINDIIATKLKLILDCTTGEQSIKVTRKDIMSAFISYASHDRFRVATLIQGIKMARPDMNVFFDIESLRCGQDWESALTEEIDSRDLLYLCWSRAASASEWVDKEWRYALETKGPEAIEPLPIESPDLCPPPAELVGKHFNDRMLYIIKATEPPELSHPCLVRFSTGDVMPLDKDITVIGKDAARVDLCITGNGTISREHCRLVHRDGSYYITDCSSVNGTYLNGQRLQPGVETVAASESVIRLANDIFEIVY